jgi:hypothetical protein
MCVCTFLLAFLHIRAEGNNRVHRDEDTIRVKDPVTVRVEVPIRLKEPVRKGAQFKVQTRVGVTLKEDL